MHRHIGTKKGVYKHTESSPRRLKEDEQVVQDRLNCISVFECFPFDPVASTLQTLQSAIPASDKLIADLKSTYADGEAKLMKFLAERVFTKVKSLFDSVLKNKRITFANERKETSTSGKDKVTTGIMERENPYRHFNANGTFRKVQKGSLIDPRVYVAIVDRGTIWRMSTPTREDRQKADASVYTWGRGDFVTKIINLVISRHQLDHHGERSLQSAVLHKG